MRISLPTFDPDELQKLIETLVAVEGEKWLPKSRPGTFLYLRPTMIATAAALGVQKPKEALLYIMACCFPSFDTPSGTAGPSGNLISQSPKARVGLKLLASKEDTVRAWPGGFGYAKVGANYGPSLIAQGEAKARGFDQVLWLLGEGCEVTEAGASNFFVLWKTRGGRLQLVTAPLDDKIILDGVTRRSILQLAREIGKGRRDCREKIRHERGERCGRRGKIIGSIHRRNRGTMLPSFLSRQTWRLEDADKFAVFHRACLLYSLPRKGSRGTTVRRCDRQIYCDLEDTPCQYHVRKRTARVGSCGK